MGDRVVKNWNLGKVNDVVDRFILCLSLSVNGVQNVNVLISSVILPVILGEEQWQSRRQGHRRKDEKQVELCLFLK